jgi:HemY protein
MPLALLLAAESARIAGRTEDARAAFQQLTTSKEMAFLGHRGLLRHTMDTGDHDSAASHASAAATSYPGSVWLKSKRLELAVKQQNWPVALTLTRRPSEIAAYATAAAQEAEPKQAVAFGKQAIRADPEFAPGIVAYAQALFAAGKARAARAALRAGWIKAPHPLIAQNWLAAAATPLERAQAAADLAAAKPGHAESEVLLAQTSLAANLTGEARRHAEAALAAGNTDGRAAAVLATLNNTGGGNALVPLTAFWRCTGCQSPQINWTPVCPTCQKPGTLVWKA